jgi:antitoxin ParD1/3/4
VELQIPSDLETIIESEVRSGRYDSANDVIREALRLLEERNHILATKGADLRAKIDEGAEALARREIVDGEEAFAQLEARLDALAAGTKAG